MNENSQVRETLVLRVVGADGNPKPVFQENRLFRWLLDKGIVSPHVPKIPFLLGRWSTHKEIVFK